MWYAVYEKATGRLHSIGTTLADPMPKEYAVKSLGETFNGDYKEWDTKALQFNDSYPLVKLRNMAASLPGLSKLTANEKAVILKFIEDLYTCQLVII